MDVQVVNGNLVITLPLQKPALSKSGKSAIVAGTGGFAASTAQVDGKVIHVSVNAIVK